MRKQEGVEEENGGSVEKQPGHVLNTAIYFAEIRRKNTRKVVVKLLLTSYLFNSASSA